MHSSFAIVPKKPPISPYFACRRKSTKSFHKSKETEVFFLSIHVLLQAFGVCVNTIGARHAVFAVVARVGVEPHHLRGGFLQECEIVFSQRFQRRICAQIVLEEQGSIGCVGAAAGSAVAACLKWDTASALKPVRNAF